MKIELLYLESTRLAWVEEALEQYSKKISHYADFELNRLKSPSKSRKESVAKIEEEAALLSRRLERSDYVIALDEKGVSVSTDQFSKLLIQQIESSRRTITFVIGGAFGLHENVKQKAQKVLSLSSLTLNHFVAQIVVVEQIYRALTIWKGHPYHND